MLGVFALSIENQLLCSMAPRIRTAPARCNSSSNSILQASMAAALKCAALDAKSGGLLAFGTQPRLTWLSRTPR
jgi:hypothetical protein